MDVSEYVRFKRPNHRLTHGVDYVHAVFEAGLRSAAFKTSVGRTSSDWQSGINPPAPASDPELWYAIRITAER